MPRGQPDFGIYARTTLAATVSDVGELAPRLGSIDTYDRRGNVLWLDDFEDTLLKWDISGVFGGIDPVHDTTRAVSGSQCVKFECAAQAFSYSRIIRHLPLVRLGKIGCEFWLQAKKVSDTRLEIYIGVYDGTNWTRATLKYYPNDGTIYITDKTGDVKVADDIFMTQTGQYFLPVKLVVDMDADIYTRLLVGEREIDLSAYELEDKGATTDKNIIVIVYLYGKAAAAVEAYMDNFIFTVNES